jgi:hypothetical protein
MTRTRYFATNVKSEEGGVHDGAEQQLTTGEWQDSQSTGNQVERERLRAPLITSKSGQRTRSQVVDMGNGIETPPTE